MSKLLLSAHNIYKSYGEEKVLEFKHLEIYEGDRIGIIGRNGCGKTTFLKLLAGKLNPDSGYIHQYVPVTFLEQLSNPDDGMPTPEKAKKFGVSEKINCKQKSGGEQARMNLAALEDDPWLLLADEPTSNLDEEGIFLCCQRLKKCRTLLLVSHDRKVLDQLCTKMILIQDGTLCLFSGNYTEFERNRQEMRQRQWEQYRNYCREKAHLEQAAARQAQKAASVQKAPSRMGNSEARLHRRAAQEKAEKLSGAGKSIQTRLKHLTVYEKPREMPDVHLNFPLTHPPISQTAIWGSGISIHFGCQVLLENAEFRIPTGSKTALVAPNGTGKTTLLKQIACGNNNIHIAPQGKIGWLEQELTHFFPNKTLLENVMEGSVQNEFVMRNILARMLLTERDWNKKAAVLSGGQRMKMFLARIIGSPCNILLLDEPTNFLDLDSIAALEETIRSYPGTVLFVSHDRAFVDGCASRILRIENHRLFSFEGNLSQFEQHQRYCRKSHDEIDQAVLDMQISRVVSQLSLCRETEKQALEEEFQRLLSIRKSRFSNSAK